MGNNSHLIIVQSQCWDTMLYILCCCNAKAGHIDCILHLATCQYCCKGLDKQGNDGQVMAQNTESKTLTTEWLVNTAVTRLVPYCGGHMVMVFPTTPILWGGIWWWYSLLLTYCGGHIVMVFPTTPILWGGYGDGIPYYLSVGGIWWWYSLLLVCGGHMEMVFPTTPILLGAYCDGIPYYLSLCC